MVRPSPSSPVAERCPCGAPTGPGSFRDGLSVREYRRSGLCQRCQDATYLAPAEGASFRPPVRSGAIAACVGSRPGVEEVALVPFVFAPDTGRVAWEARLAVWAGRGACPDVEDLEPMAGELEEHLVRVTRVGSLFAPPLADWLPGLDLLAALDASALHAMAGVLPAALRAVRIPLADALPWRDGFGLPLVPFDAFVRAFRLDPYPSLRPGALRQAALLGAALTLPESPAPGAPLVVCRLIEAVREWLPQHLPCTPSDAVVDQ